MSDNLDKSLDEIISSSKRGNNNNNKGRNNNNRNNNNGKITKGRSNTRNTKSLPYSTSQKPSNNRIRLGGPEMSIRVLISNSVAGLLIGAGGKNIKEWMEVSHTAITISNNNDTYPGTDERICTINGRQHAVDYALAILYDANAILANNNDDEKAVDWHVHISARSKSSALDNIEITNTLLVPLEDAGAIIGPGGANINAIREQSGAKISMTNKNSSQPDRLLRISGTKGSCVACTTLLLAQLVASSNEPTTKEVASATQTAVLAVTLQIGIPNQLIGNIMGRSGARLDSIKQTTGTEITVSGRNEYIEGTQNRLVTIFGPSRQAYQAKKLIEDCLV